MLNFVIDVDGVLTSGKFFYTSEGKVMKEFGPDDSDALKILSKYAKIYFMSQDKRGMAITEKRVHDMGFEVLEVASKNRKEFIESTLGLDNTIYMGDSFLDIKVSKACKWSICPEDASEPLRNIVDYVTKAKGGERAVAEAVFWILQTILGKSFDEIIESET